MRTKQELKKLAIDISEGRVFTDRHCSKEMFRLIFTGFTLAAMYYASEKCPDNYNDEKKFQKAKKKFLNDIQSGEISLVYEYMSKAVKLSVNGYPTFMSHSVLNKKETKIVLEYIDQLKKMKEEFMK